MAPPSRCFQQRCRSLSALPGLVLELVRVLELVLAPGLVLELAGRKPRQGEWLPTLKSNPNLVISFSLVPPN